MKVGSVAEIISMRYEALKSALCGESPIPMDNKALSGEVRFETDSRD